MDKTKKHWFRIDNAGKLYPSIVSTRVSTVFRFSATLYEQVNPQILQQALTNIIIRFPYFQVNLKRGLFWYYFEHTNTIPKIENETFYPCMFLFYKIKNNLPFRVLYYNKRISLEISHSITDGTGAVIFLKSLLVEYFRLKGFTVNDYSNIFSPYGKVDPNEYEDAFHKYYNKNMPNLKKFPKAFHFPFNLNKKGEYHILTGIISTSDLLTISKEYNATLTQFLLAVYFESIIDYINTIPHNKRKKLIKPIVLNVPVNLRKLYCSNTLRNFFISLTPSIDPRLGSYTLEEIINYIKHYMGMHVNRKYINQHISRNVKNEKSIFIRLLPLSVKNLLMPFIYHKFGERNYTSSISNVGKITMPSPIDTLIERFELYPAPSEGNIIKICVTSYNAKTYISFGSLTDCKEIEKHFFRNIRKMNMHVKIETN